MRSRIIFLTLQITTFDPCYDEFSFQFQSLREYFVVFFLIFCQVFFTSVVELWSHDDLCQQVYYLRVKSWLTSYHSIIQATISTVAILYELKSLNFHPPICEDWLFKSIAFKEFIYLFPKFETKLHFVI